MAHDHDWFKLDYNLSQDPKKQQWSAKQGIRWDITHNISNNEIRFTTVGRNVRNVRQ